jgi:hypothetical protein
LADVDFFFSLLSFVRLSPPPPHTYTCILARAYTNAHAHAHFRASLLLTHPFAFPFQKKMASHKKKIAIVLLKKKNSMH